VKPERKRKLLGWALFASGLLVLGTLLGLLRLSIVTDHLYHGMVKDPVRYAPAGRVVVAPADGTVIYVKPFRDGVIPEVVKRDVPIPVSEHLQGEADRPLLDGVLIGILMNTQGVHVNRVPNHGTIAQQIVFNGPHLNMTGAEREVILRQLIPGTIAARKLLGLTPFDIEDKADYVRNSARETLILEDERGARIGIVRIADYYVGKILTWVAEGERVERGQKLGLITWGSQTDLLVERTPGLTVTVEPGEYVYGGETVVATY
jgi:phosphatidylserine decarboxylase